MPKINQKGSGSSTYSGLWYASSPLNIHTLSKYTVERIDKTPMFNPLKYNTTLATPTTGLIPTGVHLGNFPATIDKCKMAKPLYLVGGSDLIEEWYDFAKKYANSNQITLQQALTNAKCKGSFGKKHQNNLSAV